MTAAQVAPRHDSFAAGKRDVTRQAEARDWAGAASSWVHALVLEIADTQNRWTASLMHGGRADWAPGGPLTRRLHSAMRSTVDFTHRLATDGPETTVRALLDAWEDAA